MNSSSTQFFRMGIYDDQVHQIGTWGDHFKGGANNNAFLNNTSPISLDNQSEEDTTSLGPSNNPSYDHEAIKPEKVQRRLAQNREAARKSRLRKKAYVQQLETSRLKLIQLEQELHQSRVRKQGLYMGGGLEAGHLGFSASRNSGIAAFEMEYGHWLEEENNQIVQLRTALHAHISDVELRILVEGGMSHYFELFRMKASAAKDDVFFLMSGTWKTPVERFFLWIGGFRPSELLKVLEPQLEPLTEEQDVDVCNLKQSCQQAEDALSQGMDKLQQNLLGAVAWGRLGEGCYNPPQMATSIEKLEALVIFTNQADHLRQETLQQMSSILTTRQAARGLLAMVLVEYTHCLIYFPKAHNVKQIIALQQRPWVYYKNDRNL